MNLGNLCGSRTSLEPVFCVWRGRDLDFRSSLPRWHFGEGPLHGSVVTLLNDGRYPIGLLWPPPPDQTTVERYQEIAAAGFNFVIGGNGVTSDSTNPGALDAAAACNLRFLLTDGKLRSIIRNSTLLARASRKRRKRASCSVSLREATRARLLVPRLVPLPGRTCA